MFELKGKIQFDPVNVTRKHSRQSSWKKTAMIKIDDDTWSYYAWFIEKRFNLKLNKPLRGTHITIINDEFIECSFGSDLAAEIGSSTSVSDNLIIFNPDGTFATPISVTIRDNLASVCDDSPLHTSRPSSYTVAPSARSVASSTSTLGGSSNPYILCDINDFQKAMEYDLFANRFTYLKSF
jgi:hypothetical protein